MPLEIVMFVKNEYLVYIQTYCFYDMQIWLSVCFLYQSFTAGFHVFSGRFINYSKTSLVLPLSHLQRGTSNVPHFFQNKGCFPAKSLFFLSITRRREWNGTGGLIRVKDTTTSTIDMSLNKPVQDDITNSVCTFVPCAAILLPRIRPAEISQYEQELNVR